MRVTTRATNPDIPSALVADTACYEICIRSFLQRIETTTTDAPLQRRIGVTGVQRFYFATTLATRAHAFVTEIVDTKSKVR
jgi:hypothetical protein